MEGTIEKHPDAKVASTARLDVGEGGRIILGPGCEIRDGAHFEVYDEGVVTIGPRAVIGVNVWIQGNGDVTIGADSGISAGAVILSSHHLTDLARPIMQQPLAKRATTIGRDVWIGANATIVAGVRIGDRAIVSANSFVTGDIEDELIAVGVPARVMGRRSTMPVRRRFLFPIAVGITDRPARCHAIARFYATLGNTLCEEAVDSWYICHPAAAKGLARIRKDRKIVREDHRDFGNLLDEIQPDVMFLWNGAADAHAVTRRFAQERGIPILYGELGWFPQSTTLYFDPDGTNARSSIRRLDLSSVPVHPRLDAWLETWRQEREVEAPDRSDYVFVPLQDENDVNITLGSPYPTMNEFVGRLAARFPGTQFVVRPHPHFRQVKLANWPNVDIRDDGTLHGWIRNSHSVVGLNSTVLLEALAWGKPTHSLATGIATGLDVFFEAGSVEELDLTQAVTPARNDRTRRLLSELIFVRQSYRKDLHYLERVKEMFGIAELLVEHRQSAMAHLHRSPHRESRTVEA